MSRSQITGSEPWKVAEHGERRKARRYIGDSVCKRVKFLDAEVVLDGFRELNASIGPNPLNDTPCTSPRVNHQS